MKLYSQIILIFFLATFIVNKTWFVPDEHFQSIQLAYTRVYSIGETVWEFDDAIRSGLFYGLYEYYLRVLQYLHIDTTFMINEFPRVITFSLMIYVQEKRIKHNPLILFHWMHLFMGPRTLVNTMEYIIYTGSINSKWFYPLMSLGCIIRPTLGIFYFPIFLNQVREDLKCVFNWIFWGTASFGFSILIDTYYYQRWTSSIWNFFNFNVVHNFSEFYGTHNGLWYITSALPTLLGGCIIYFIVGLFKVSRKDIFYISIPLLIFSLMKHKEFRFLYPHMDKYLDIALVGYNALPNKHLKIVSQIVNIFLILLFCFVHQSGIYAAFDILKFENISTLMIFAPCYSFPGQSYLHSNISIIPLRCDPPHMSLVLPQQEDYYSDPASKTKMFLEQHKPSHVLKFSNLKLDLQDFSLKYSIFNSYFHDDSRRLGDVEIWVRKD
eukprot:NODE_4_length_77007_cov_1.156642.p18 type:complete len:437 gc:universal NODE_4_length_77007_cov_1.156642:66455-67765(+)